jgi:chromosome segregation ATPase
MDDAGLGDLGDVLEARRRIVVAFEGIAAGAEALAAVAAQASEIERLRTELEEERLVNAQLQERVRALRERDPGRAPLEEELARLRAEMADLRSAREAERGEIDAVLKELIPLVEEAS